MTCTLPINDEIKHSEIKHVERFEELKALKFNE